MRYIVLFILSTVVLSAQPPPVDRYTAEVFTGVTETNNVIFSTNVPKPKAGGGFYEYVSGYPLNAKEWDTTPVTLRMDIFEPTGDTLSKRPVIIICFGGGFLGGSRDYWSMRLLCQKLARRGYVVASIDYRLGMNVFDSDLAMRAVYRGVQDGRSAVRFFKADANGANNYKVDPDNIFIGGHSSGGFIALHNAYLDKESERPISTYNWSQSGHSVADQLCLDCVGNNQTYNGQAKAVFGLAGAVGFTELIESADDKNVSMFHSTDDSTVPYYSGEPFSGILWLVVGSDLPTVYGSGSIALRGDAVGLNYDFNSYTNREHEVHENGTSALYTDIVPSISNWFFNESLKPQYDKIAGDTIVCTNELTQSYHLPPGVGAYFDWQITGGVFTMMSNYNDTIEVLWNSASPIKSISVTPYSKLDAKGTTVQLAVESLTSGSNQYLYNSVDWNDISNWSLGHSPNHCEDVMIPNAVTSSQLTLDTITRINSIEIGSNVELNITNNGKILVYQKKSDSALPAMKLNGVVNNNGLLELINKKLGNELSVESGLLNNSSSGILKVGK